MPQRLAELPIEQAECLVLPNLPLEGKVELPPKRVYNKTEVTGQEVHCVGKGTTVDTNDKKRRLSI